VIGYKDPSDETSGELRRFIFTKARLKTAFVCVNIICVLFKTRI